MAERYFPQPSVMSAQQHFSQVPSADIERSRFDQSHGLKTTFDAGFLVPIFISEVLPGDSFNLHQTCFARLATPLKPVMDNLHIDTQYWFVPNRLVWQNWQRFCGERTSPTDDPSLLSIPTCGFDLALGDGTTLQEYFGLPPVTTGGPNVAQVQALPFRAYNLIWNEWYRDQNLQDPVPFTDGDGPDDPADYILLRRGKRRDYFTSCLPWPQKGNPVLIPFAVSAPVVGIGADAGTGFTDVNSSVTESDGSSVVYPLSRSVLAGSPSLRVEGTAGGVPQIFADLSEATAITINDLRQAFQIQKFLERDARGGTRYIEKILAHFGVRSDDARLQRPEYLGGGSSRVNVNPIAATATVGSVPQANLAATVTGVNRSGFNKSFTEHGFIIGVCSVRADLTYQQGIERFWWRQTVNELYWPTYAHLGEQAVLNREIFYTGNVTPDGDVFGYQERYAEYRYKPSRITGKFNSGVASSLDVWHLSQDFAATPLLNADFIEEQPPVARIIAVPDEPHFLADFWFDLKADRPMPVYSIPGLIDHF